MKEISSKNPIQVRFFERIKQSISSNVSLAADLSDLLELSQDGVYRRMRGETVLSMDELVKVCNHYKISPDTIVSVDDNTATFQFRKLNKHEKGLEDYLHSMLNDLLRIQAAPNAHVIYAAGDIPVFHHFMFPELTAFKLFYWQRAVMNIPSVDGKKFNISEIREDFKLMCNKIIEAYIKVPSTEIWHIDTVVTNLTMLEYAWEAGWFDSKDKAVHICKQFGDEMTHVEKQAMRNSKFIKEEKWAENEGNFTMYQSEVFLSSNQVLVTAGSTQVAYLTHNSFNSMSTTNPVFVSETDAWLQTLMKKSIQISGVAEKQRHRFFQRAHDNINGLVERIKAS